jgi:hypothetical protein
MRYLRFIGIGFGLIAACCDGNDLKRYYPLDAGFTWSYALTIRRTVDTGDPIDAARTVTNLPTRTLNGRGVTPQETRQFDQIQLRFISEEVDGIVEIAVQSILYRSRETRQTTCSNDRSNRATSGPRHGSQISLVPSI